MRASAGVPYWLKNTVCQAKNKDVLDRFFAKVVIDAVDLFLFENFSNLAVEFTGRGQVMSKGFFDDNARPTLTVSIQASGTEILNDLRILAGRSRKVEDAVTSCSTFVIDCVQEVIESLIAFKIVKIRLEVTNTGGKTFPDLRIDRFLSGILIDRLKGLLSKLVIVVGAACKAYN